MQRRVALVTGASSGIGVAFAERLAAEGYDLCIVARRTERLEALKARIEGSTEAKVHVMPADLAKPAQIRALAERLEAAGLEIDCLINNAGFGYQDALQDRRSEDWERMIQVNCSGLVALTRALLPAMIARGRGEILNVASIASFQAVATMSVYAASKAFVLSFSEGLRLEVKRHGVHVSCLCPGATISEFSQVAETKHAKPPAIAWMTADAVARSGLRAMHRNKPVVIPGLLYKLMIYGQALLPRCLVNALTAYLMRPISPA